MTTYSSTISGGRTVVTTAGTAVQLTTTGTAALQVAITAETDNTGVIAVGGSGVVAALATRKGIPLNAGDTVTFEAIDLADVYLDSTVNGDGVTYAYTAD